MRPYSFYTAFADPALLSNGRTGETMLFSNEAINGRIMVSPIEPGCFARLWDCSFREDSKIISSSNDTQRVYVVSYILTPAFFQLDEGSGWLAQLNEAMSLILTPPDTRFSYLIKAGQTIRSLDIFMEEDWLKRSMRQPEPSFLRPASTSLLFGAIIPADRRTVLELFDGDVQQPLYFKSRILSLVANLSTAGFQTAREQALQQKPFYEAMLVIEKRLLTTLTTKLPPLAELSREVSMSPSSLKRHFREVFGKAIYEYYLEKKMLHGRDLILQHSMSVDQAAYTLGYEKASPFIRIFKKQFGYSPGTLKGKLTGAG
ncbi:MAG: AraC family transcriptional regulator [Chitinophagaceae bacterium]